MLHTRTATETVFELDESNGLADGREKIYWVGIEGAPSGLSSPDHSELDRLHLRNGSRSRTRKWESREGLIRGVVSRQFPRPSIAVTCREEWNALSSLLRTGPNLIVLTVHTVCHSCAGHSPELSLRLGFLCRPGAVIGRLTSNQLSRCHRC